ncbi:uncharacterized protein ARMOST_03471 [Armillaria ostoyae]|uniref:Uncharacterized protein n=1 Tax=Armillaria ostoyae TaxID=47428 RepID=A0A284QUN9_ARMOS|nr:uncharacterized protein ARMOST_03471 [Armillaria ostoyae]
MQVHRSGGNESSKWTCQSGLTRDPLSRLIPKAASYQKEENFSSVSASSGTCNVRSLRNLCTWYKRTSNLTSDRSRLVTGKTFIQVARSQVPASYLQLFA